MPIRDILCYKCLVKTGEEVTKRTTASIKGRKLCNDCYKQHIAEIIERNKSNDMRESVSNRMKNSNPMKNSDVSQKVSTTLKYKFQNDESYRTMVRDISKRRKLTITNISKEGRKKLSDNMSKNNPMFNEECRQKRLATFTNRVKSGDIQFKHGPEHWLWKGNRDFNNSCRVQLYPIWIKPILERDSFRCVKCGSKDNIQVHHIRPLRDIINIVMNKYDIKTFDNILIDEWWIYIQEVVSLHTLEDGITLCCDCHDDIDEYYHKKRE